MPERPAESIEALRRRLERERKARREAESIAERVTGQLYSSATELERLNGELQGANQELQTLNQAMRDFVAVASHDLRSPLTSIVGASKLLTTRWQDLNDDRRGEFLEMIERQSHHLSRMVEDLLTVSRIEAGQLDTRKEVIKLRQEMERIVNDFGQPAREIHVDAIDCEVVADPDHLRRILVNYVGNALKYGLPPVEIETAVDNGWVDIRVKDHGDGVPADFVPRLFGKFARGETSTGGTGLGLSIVQGLARANGGDTWYEPNSPQGSCFAVRLPRVPAVA
jgi:signal transduction histidine kinase